jgi:hypothetical protein
MITGEAVSLTFEKVWDMSQQTGRQLKEISQQQKETEGKISKPGSRLGDLVEEN